MLLVLAVTLLLSAVEGSLVGSTPVASALRQLGEPAPAHYLPPNAESARKGREIVLEGRTTDAKGRRTDFVSKYYSCTSCHNIEREDPDLRFSDPEARLPYVKAKGIPFLQGSTFRGIVNRESWYNDDYVRKYGADKIGRAHGDLREAIQLCAVECSQGRPMEAWEIDAVLAYFWTLQFTLDDLGLGPTDLEKLNQGLAVPEQRDSLRQWLRSFYAQQSPAHFYDSPPSKQDGYPGLSGNPSRGKDLYELSCLHCHQAGGVSHYPLGNDQLSFRHLNKMIPKDSHFSLYQIIAYGTYAIPGHRPYMPHYPAERMSKQQVEDLRAYIELRAKK
ncbi:c-type cytochrome [Lewinella lacunae]|uniref:C-type cytochrome n=2 Tax=Neolewinella lacunae TaxID=1517758 RepID=A0A923PME0_9BACT|nr:cytochrome c [Neolewinella lacunae]MBC6995376.1 c-type cytochrome [Neolewinella lacunae]